VRTMVENDGRRMRYLIYSSHFAGGEIRASRISNLEDDCYGIRKSRLKRRHHH